MGNGILRQLGANAETLDDCSEPSNVDLSGSSFLSSRQLAELNLQTNVVADNSSTPKSSQRFGVFPKALCATGVVRRLVLPT
jgi:hypothetical protein